MRFTSMRAVAAVAVALVVLAASITRVGPRGLFGTADISGLQAAQPDVT